MKMTFGMGDALVKVICFSIYMILVRHFVWLMKFTTVKRDVQLRNNLAVYTAIASNIVYTNVSIMP